MRTSFVTFVLLAVAASPSLAAPIAEVQERALPAILPEVVEVGGSLLGGLFHKNNDNKRAINGIEAGLFNPHYTESEKRAIKGLLKSFGTEALKGAGSGILTNAVSGDDSDNSQRRSIGAITKFVGHEAGDFLGSQAADAVTGSDNDNQRRSFGAITKFVGKEAGNFLGSQAADAVTGSDNDNQRRSFRAITKLAGNFLGSQAADAVTGSDNDNQRRSATAIIDVAKDIGKQFLGGAAESAGGAIVDKISGDDSDDSQKRSFRAITKLAGNFLGSQAADAVTGSDNDNQRRSVKAITKGIKKFGKNLGTGALTGAGETVLTNEVSGGDSSEVPPTTTSATDSATPTA